MIAATALYYVHRTISYYSSNLAIPLGSRNVSNERPGFVALDSVWPIKYRGVYFQGATNEERE